MDRAIDPLVVDPRMDRERMSHLPSGERCIQPMLDRADGPPMSQIIGDEGEGLSSSVGLRLTEIHRDFAS